MVIAIISVLSGVILFSVTQYINKGKDSNIYGNMAVLVVAGEVWYDGNRNSYSGFCDPAQNSVIKNSIAQMPENQSGYCYSGNNLAGLCCAVASDNNSWAACAREFTAPNNVYCVDSRAMKEEIPDSNCSFINTTFQCP